MTALPITLKESPRRSVRVEYAPSSAAGSEVVKRFHGRGFLARARDRRRARSEHALLDGLWRDGFPVPRPIALRESARGAELAMEWIADAVTLEDAMHGRAPWPRTPESAARALGALLARAHALGLDHPDLHAGNVLLDAGGDGAWLVDLHGARRTEPLRAKTRLRDLITVAADTRERLSEGFRSRFWISYWQSFAEMHGPAGPPVAAVEPEALFAAPRAELARTIEAAARARRWRVVERSRRRWTRRSSVCAPFEVDGVRGFRSIAVDDALLANILRMAGRAHSAQSRDEHAPVHAVGGAHHVVACRTSKARDTLACWYGAARLCEHGLSSARPLVLTQSPRSWAGFAVPEDARSAREALSSLGASGRGLALESLGELLGGFDDRGFAVSKLTPQALWLARDGRALFAPESGLLLERASDDERHADSDHDPRPLLRAVGIESATERRHAVSAFVRAHRGGNDQRALVRERLGG